MSDQNNILSVIVNDISALIKPNDPKYTYLDWDNFNGADWYATRQNCYQFGEITVIINNYNPGLKLFIAKEIANVFDYNETHHLTQILESENFRSLSKSNLREINGLQQIFESQGREISPQGMKIVNYAGFNHAVMKSTKDPAKVIQQWVYADVLTEIAETGNYLNNVSGVRALEDRIVNTLTPLIEEINELKNTVKILSDKVAVQNQSGNNISLVKVYFTVFELINYINKNFKVHNSTNQFTLTDLRDFLLNDIRMIKGSYNPYAKYVNNGYITYNMEFSHIGLNFVINSLRNKGLIS